MEIILKILLALVFILCCYTSYFTFNEYGKLKRSPELDEGSMFDRFIIFLLAWGGILFLLVSGLTALLFMISKITVELPW